MSTVVDKAFERAAALQTTSFANAMQLKSTGGIGDQIAVDNLSLGGGHRQQAANRIRYSSYRGWLYSAIHALSTEAAGQPVSVYDKKPTENVRAVLDRLMHTKGNHSMLSKHERDSLEILPNHPLVATLEHPNPIQYRFQFVYSFVANLLLTGWSYIVGGTGEDGKLELYSLPTTWITPDHSKGAFSEFKLKNPAKPAATEETLTRDQVAFAHLPNPGNPMSALAPAESQMLAIRVDDHIQTSQERFFENGIFPSIVVTVGKNPHPELQGGGGVRPRLTNAQRRQIHRVIRTTMGTVANYGVPAIVDGLIERIDRFSATQNEMGWEKSEDKVKRRILSAFGLHSFVLGEDLPGSYAQAYIIDDRTCRKINTYLSMLDTVISNFVGEGEVEVFWTPCISSDPDLERKWWDILIRNNLVDEHEARAKVQLPPREKSEETTTSLLNTVGGVTALINLFREMAAGVLTGDQVAQLVAFIYQIPLPTAQGLIVQEAGTAVGTSPPPMVGDETVQEAVGDLRSAIKMLGRLK